MQNFLIKNGHRALKNSQDEEERKIAIEYEEKCINGMSQEKVDIINKIFNNKRSARNACAAYINNIKARQGNAGKGERS